MNNIGKTKKLVALAVSVMLTLGSAACGFNNAPPDGENPSTGTGEDTRTKLFVGVYDGAVGYAWAQEIEKLYEAKHPDVNVVINHKKNEYDDSMLLANDAIKYNEEDIYFASSNSIDSLVGGGYIEDLTDLVNEKIYDDNGNLTENSATKSIVDTMWPAWRDIYKTDDKYYVIPNFTPVVGINYDADLFAEKGYSVPQTYSELKILMDRMVNDGITPFSFSSIQEYIIGNAAIAMAAQYEGVDNFILNSTFSGTHSVLGEITLQNAYKLQETGGKRAAVQFMRDLAVNSSYTTEATKNGQTHLNAQAEFVSNGFGFDQKKRVAMLLENCFWEREAKAEIDSMGEINPDEWGWGKRNFKFMSMPADGKLSTKNTVLCSYASSYVFINANSSKKEIAKDFLKFVQSREGLATYFIHSGTTRPYSFELTESEKAQCTPYALSVYETVHDQNTDLTPFAASNPVAKAIPDFLSTWIDGSKMNNSLQASPYAYFKLNSTRTVDEYLNGAKEWMSESAYAGYYKTATGKAN